MEYKNIITQLQHQKIPEPSQERKEQTWNQINKIYKQSMTLPNTSSGYRGWFFHWQSFALGTMMATLVGLALLFRNPSVTHNQLAEEDDLKVLINGRVLFAENFQGVAFRNGKSPEFLVSAKKHNPSVQPITVEIDSGVESIRYITFSGERIRIPTVRGDLVEVEVLVDGNQDVFLVGDDFILKANTLNESLGIRFRAKVHQEIKDHNI